LAVLAERDGLTGCLNHRTFHERLQAEAIGADHSHPLSLLIIDIDKFKTVNDTYGHPAGDEAIRDVAWVLQHSFRSADIIARMGGDEFAVYAPEASPESTEVMLRRLAKWQEERNREPGRPFSISLSAGGAAWTKAQPRSLEAMLAEADAAAYRAKRR